ncbi:MAG: hypothetical protein ACKOXB_09550 [Flavobacteriales bacterium]
MNKLKSLKATLVGLTVLSIVAVSCKKDTKEDIELRADATAIEQLFDQLDPEMQSFTIDPSQPNTIAGKDGMVIQIPANALVDASGKAVTGNVTVSLMEMLSVKDQLLSGVSATSDGKLLSSGGEFFFEVRNDQGEKLNVSPSIGLTFEWPTDQVDSTMQVFIGDTTSNGDINWTPADSTYVTEVQDTTTKDSSDYFFDYELYFALDKYMITVRNLYNTSYYNCDRFIYNDNYLGQLKCELKVGNQKEKEAVDYAINVVYKQYGSTGWGGLQGVVETSDIKDVYDVWLAGEDVTVVVIGRGQKSKKSYFGTVSFNIAAGSVPSITIDEISDADLEIALGAL